MSALIDTSASFWGAIEIMKALATPAIAYAGYSIARSNLSLQAAKREDDLFAKRFEAYKKLRNCEILICTKCAEVHTSSMADALLATGINADHEYSHVTPEKVRRFIHTCRSASENIFAEKIPLRDELRSVSDLAYHALCDILHEYADFTLDCRSECEFLFGIPRKDTQFVVGTISECSNEIEKFHASLHDLAFSPALRNKLTVAQ